MKMATKKLQSKKATKKAVTKASAAKTATKKKVRPQKPVAKRKKQVVEKEVAVVAAQQDGIVKTVVNAVKEHPTEFIIAFMFGLALSTLILF